MKYTKIVFVMVASLVVTGCMGPTSKTIKPNDAAVAIEARKQKELVMEEGLETTKRLADVSRKILIAGLPFCEDNKKKSLGIYPSNKYQFDDESREIAIDLFDLSETVSLLHVVEGSPAEQAGLKEGDILLEINDYDVASGPDAANNLSEHLSENTEDEVSILVMREGEKIDYKFVTEEQCNYPASLSGETIVNAFADGKRIIITQGMMEFARDDNELALVIGHELAHNVMEHIDKKQINALGGAVLDILVAVTLGVNTDAAFTKAAAGAYSQEFEAEADYVGLYISELAGYDISKASFFWRRMGVKHPGSIQKNHAASHPSTPERFVAIEASVEEIEHKRKNNEVLMPNIDTEELKEKHKEATARDSTFDY